MKRKIWLPVLLTVLFALGANIALAGQETGYWITDEDENPLYRIYEEGDWWYYYETEEGSTLYQYNGSETTISSSASLHQPPPLARFVNGMLQLQFILTVQGFRDGSRKRSQGSIAVIGEVYAVGGIDTDHGGSPP